MTRPQQHRGHSRARWLEGAGQKKPIQTASLSWALGSGIFSCPLRRNLGSCGAMLPLACFSPVRPRAPMVWGRQGEDVGKGPGTTALPVFTAHNSLYR